MSTVRLAFSYLAFSTPQQSEGRSSERQHGGAQEWCEANGFVLAPSRQYCDEGVSRFHGRARMKGALSRFLKLCGTAAVPPGSVLVVEDFDRLSRENPDDAWELFRSILLQDVEIVVLSLSRWFKRDSLMNFADRLLIQACQHRAHSESAMKSRRQKDIWADRRKRAAAGKGIQTNLPTWVRRAEGGALELIPDRAETVRLIVQWCLEGMGCRRIANRLEVGDEARHCWLQRGNWDSEGVQQILKRPALWGAYQPTRMDEQRRPVPSGDLVRGHYPAVVTEEVAERVRRAMGSRKRERGRSSARERNVLRYVARCAETGGCLRIKTTRGVKGTKREGFRKDFLDRVWQGKGQSVVAYETLEAVVLRAVQEWSPDAMADANGAGPKSRAGELHSELKAIDDDRAAILAELRKPGRAATTAAILAGQLDELDARESAAKSALADEQSGRPAAAALADCQSLIESLDSTPEASLQAKRKLLNERLRELLEGVWVYRHRWTVQTGEVIVQIWPRCGAPKTTRLILGVPLKGWVPLDVGDADFRLGYPARIKGGAKKDSQSDSGM